MGDKEARPVPSQAEEKLLDTNVQRNVHDDITAAALPPAAAGVDLTLPLSEDADDSPENQALDDEADEMLLEYARTQAEVQQMLVDQRNAKDELSGLKEGLTTELQDETWKLNMYNELEMIKSQLAKLTNLEANLDDAEAALDAADDADDGREVDPMAATLARINRRAAAAVAAASSAQRDAIGHSDQNGGSDGGAADGGEEDDGEELDYEGEAAEIAKLQASLDDDLAQMYAQLQTVKAQAAGVAVRKAELEAELQSLILMQEQDQRERDSDRQADEEGVLLSVD